jgi:hypothetical protein
VIRVYVTETGVREVAATFTQLGNRAADPRPAFLMLARDFTVDERLRFLSRGYGQWPPNTEGTKRKKQQRGLDPRVMRATHKLLRSLTLLGDSNQIYEASMDEMRFGTKAFYGKFLIGRRPFLTLEANRQRHIVKTLQRHLIPR